MRQLPSVDKVISDPGLKSLEQSIPHGLIVELARQHLDQIRLSIGRGNPCPPFAEIVESVYAQAQALTHLSLSSAINATGVILHTNLGRAPLSQEAIAAMGQVSESYSNLELDLSSGRRGSRQVHIEQVLCQLTGAEAALVVNNNASAVLLALTALARRKEVIVSRGQAVEIGGGFRVPDVMRQSGAKLVEVGTTNCTYVADYEEAITSRTAALLRVHPSNFKVLGFTHWVALEELVALGQRHDLPVFDDLGSGCFLDTTEFGLAPEPMVQQSIALGTSLVFFSGDKLVGGPQAGIIVGQKALIDKLKKHPLSRALRIDKIRLAGLSATLLHYLKGEAVTKVPVWRMIAASLDDVHIRANLWAQALDGLAQVIAGETMIGGGSLPGGTVPTKLVALGGGGRRKNTAQALAQKLRRHEPPLIGRIHEDMLLLDPRSVLPEDDQSVLPALRAAIADLKQP